MDIEQFIHQQREASEESHAKERSRDRLEIAEFWQNSLLRIT